MSDELWRVADLKPNAPAHRMVINGDQVRTACNWEPTVVGTYITRAAMLSLSRFCCRFCAETTPVRSR